MSSTKTTGKKTPTRTASAARKTAVKTTARKKAAVAPKPAATAVSKPAPAAGGFPDALRKKELVEKVVARAGIKKRDAKPVIEAMLAELGETLAAGRSLVLPPLGRLKVNREKKLANGRVLVVKLRQTDPPLKAVLDPVDGGAQD